MFKSLKIGLLLLVLAFVLPTLVFADKAPPPKTSILLSPYNGQIIREYSLTSAVMTGTDQVLCFQITANYIIPCHTGQGIVRDTKRDNKSCNIAAYNLLKSVRPDKSLYLNLRQSGKDRVGWQSSLHNLNSDTSG